MMSKYMGVWLDQRAAMLVTLEGRNESVRYIESNVDESHPKGGYGSSKPYSHQDTISEKSFQERRKHRLSGYYQEIIKALQDCDKFCIMGPAEAKIGLQKVISKNLGIRSKLTVIASTDSLTENQIKAKVRACFSGAK